MKLLEKLLVELLEEFAVDLFLEIPGNSEEFPVILKEIVVATLEMFLDELRGEFPVEF